LTFHASGFIVKYVLNQQPQVELLLQALADPTRRRIVERLGQGPATVKQLAEPLPISLAAVMQHLQVLERVGLVESQKVGRSRVCQLDVAQLDAIDQWVAARRQTWERRLDRLGEMLDSEPEPEHSKPGEKK
jgi:DNA-binding transcriptional ArsR family regulator